MEIPALSSASSLSRRIVLWTGFALFVILALFAWGGSRLLEGRVSRNASESLSQAAEQAALVIDRVVAERERQVSLLASLPSVVDAARHGSDLATRMGLVGQSIETLERRFDSTRTLDVDPRTRDFLLDRATFLDLAEVLVTDVHGFNVLTTERTSDFVQSDESWWQQAMAKGLTSPDATYDSSAKQISSSVSSAVRGRDTAAPVGVMKAVFGLTELQGAVRAAATPGVVVVDVIDSAGRVLAGSDTAPLLQPLADHQALPRQTSASIFRYGHAPVQFGTVRTTNRKNWRVVAHSPEALALADLRRGRTALGVGAVGLFLLLLGALAAVNGFMTKRITRPAAALAATAESVAAGDLSVQVAETGTDDEMGRLARATRTMISGLRNLTLAIKGSAAETASMALDLTAGSEEMSALSQRMAQMSAELHQRSAEMAQTIQAMSDDAARMNELSVALTNGMAEGTRRNQRLRAFARENRERLDASARELELLVNEVQLNVAAAETLATASEESREFVALMQHMARQSKLLAFSAGMEAKRAGAEGAGFVVIAQEVQRLADRTGEAAERTEKVVTALLAKVGETRLASSRAATAAASVRHATHQGLQSFGQVEAAVADTEAWTAAIEQGSRTTSSVVEATSRRLDALARGTEAFAAAMQEVAASAEEQSASSEEIVGTATSLAESAERLAEQAGAFRLQEGASAASVRPAP